MTYGKYQAKAVEITKGRQMIELIQARWGLPNPRLFNNTFGQNRNQFQPCSWGAHPQQNQQQRQLQQQRTPYNSTNAPRLAFNNVQVPMDFLAPEHPTTDNNTRVTMCIQTWWPHNLKKNTVVPDPKDPVSIAGNQVTLQETVAAH
jgi:hypothetical protein